MNFDTFLLIQNLVKEVENLMNKNERLDKEVHGLLNTIRELERVNNSTKERLANCENVLVHSP